MDDTFYKQLQENELYQFLEKHQPCRVYFQDGYQPAIYTSRGGLKLFNFPSNFWQYYITADDTNGGKLSCENLLRVINRIIRIEKQFEDKWLPVWTTADGFINTDYEHFAYIHNRYYTFKELEQVIEEVLSLKKTVSALKVY